MKRWSLAALAVFIVPFLIYLEGFRYAGSGDTQPAELLPITLLEDGDLDFREFVKPGDPLPYWYQERGGRIISIYPILPGLLNVPVYAAAGALGADLYADRIRLSMISASLISALSVAFLFLALDRLARRRSTAILLAVAYAFGTCVWSVASRGMFQHGPSLLLQSIALWLLTRGDGASAAWSGLFLGLAVVNRPMNLLVAVPLAVVVWWKHRDRAPAFAALAAVPLLLRAVYARVYWGNPFSMAQADPFPAVSHFGGNAALGLAGLLVSPSRGLLVYSPFLLLAAFAIVPAWRSRRQQPLFLALLTGALAVLLVTSKWTIWWGGHSFGYRLLIEMLPALILLMALAWDAVMTEHPARKAAFFACLAWSVFLQSFGARHQPTGFNQRLDEDPSVLWSLPESDAARAIRNALPRIGTGRR